jgi:hypothetical protein
MADVDSYIPSNEQFQLFWPMPIRAHVGVDINFRFCWYEVNNEQLGWALSNAPAWMSINPSTGLVSGVPPSEGTHFNITVIAQRASGLQFQRQFNCTVENDNFVFVSPSGNDSNPGTLASPKLTIAGACATLNNVTGKTIYLRAGTYNEGYTATGGGVDAAGKLFDGKSRTVEDYHHLRGYPGEVATWTHGSAGGPDISANYILISNLEINGGTRTTFCYGLWLTGDYIVVSDNKIRDVRPNIQDNIGAVGISATDSGTDRRHIVVTRNVLKNVRPQGYPTTDPSGSGAGVYCFSKGSTGNFRQWVINNKIISCQVGVKTKHVGDTAGLIVQNNEFVDCGYRTIQVGGRKVAVRHNVAIDGGYYDFYVTDEAGGGANGVLFEKNTSVYRTHTVREASMVFPGANNKDGIFKYNIVYNGAGTSLPVMQLWQYSDDWSAGSMDINYNCYYNTPDSNGFQTRNGMRSFATWKTYQFLNSSTPDANSVKTDPQFVNVSTGNLDILPNSPAANLGGTYAGALMPGENYGLFGTTTETLIDFNINGATTVPPEPEPPAPHIGTTRTLFFGRKRF